MSTGRAEASRAPAREAVEPTANEMSPGMATERVRRQQSGVHHHDRRSDADAEPAVEEERGEPFPPETHEQEQRAVQRVAVQILEEPEPVSPR